MENHTDINRILELMPQPVFCVRDGVILYCNHAARQLFLEPSLPVAELLGDTMEDYCRFHGGSLCLTLSLPGRNVGACVTPMDDMDVFVVDQDQTELQAMALAALQFREPLSDVLSILKRMPAQQDFPYWGHLNRRLFQMQRLVFNMSDAARYTSDNASRQVCMDICNVVDELFQRIDVLTEKNGIKLVRSLPRERVMTMLNEEKLERALFNMISNAMKVTPKGGTIEASLSWVKNRLYLSVRDFGDGIPDNVMSSVYTRYLRQPGLDNGQEGLGLGMTLIRSAATEHGGALLIDHPDGVGTRVTMSMAIWKGQDSVLRSNMLSIDYAGEQDHGLLELADILPPELYSQDS